jgi:transcriptional regulator with XRE-family HTH domain
VTVTTAYAGARLRAIRRQQGLSLHDVEARSGQEFKTAILGAYERGERALSVERLLRLAALYHVPPSELLPPGDATEIDLTQGPDLGPAHGITLNLVALHQLQHPDAEALLRYAGTIQLQRQDFNGRMLTIRHYDAQMIAAVLGQPATELESHLDGLGLRVPASDQSKIAYRSTV